YHVVESILDRRVDGGGRARRVRSSTPSNAAAILATSSNFFPILAQARVVESRVVRRGVQADQEETDARPTELIAHGFGCWSVLSGKICSSVWMGEHIARAVRRATYPDGGHSA